MPISHTSKQGTLTTPSLISKQAIPFQRRGDTCCPRVSTPRIRSLADSSLTNHITWQNPTVSTIPTLFKPQHRSSPWSNHISTDGRQSLTKTLAKLNITKDGKTCTTLMTAWPSITNHIRTQILSMRLRYNIEACRPLHILENEISHRINMVKAHLPCSPTSCCSKSWTSSSYRFSKSSAPNGSERKQATQANKWTVEKQCLLTKQADLKDATHCYERVSARIT
jgi:hypothetical protein